MGSLAGSGEQSRFSLRCQRSGRLLRHLRFAEQSRHGLRGDLARYAGFRRAFHRHLVETRRMRVARAMLPSCWFWRTPVAARVVVPGPGRPNFKRSCAIHSASRLPSLNYPAGVQMEPLLAPPLLGHLQNIGPPSQLVSYQNVLGFIRNTSTKTGLVVTAYMDRKEYPTGLKPDRRLISALDLKPGKVLPRWNYSIASNL